MVNITMGDKMLTIPIEKIGGIDVAPIYQPEKALI